MKALTVKTLSPDLSGVDLADVPMPQRQSGEVLVRIRAASLNFPDLLMTRGEYQFKPELPFVAGLEFAGEVVEADPDSGYAPGDTVYGGNKTGGFAEYAAVPARALSRMPHGIGFPAAAALGAAYGTAYTALVEIGGLQAGQWVLVHGASGGVGLAAVELAKRLGAHVIATTGSPAKLKALRAACQADAVIMAEGRIREAVAELTGGKLCDLVYDPVGGDIFDESTRCVAFGGKLLVIGFAGGRIAEISTNIPLIKGFSVVGVRAGEYARRFPERGRAIREAVATLAADGRLSPHIDRVLPLECWREAYEAMQRREVVGKVVLEP
ncbi:NADPH:quinone oxidoreductase family protein [Novosphingobium sp.]|uniref:NADPH:quinone oxidoreductase family protein n=1 Tax=Novosphingobium sp. TaxID=1874826 RepID=UPI0025E0C27D|nr:NADPH:quinone oxidoreductase family protein [Novosphingobium sp.]MCC6927006.1 NADPH:quinone oxidoreductase family protein [Novosphingobium sp.]